MNATRKARRTARRLFRLCLVDGRLDAARVRLVAERLSSSGRRGRLGVLSCVEHLVRLDRNRHTATVESATDLADEVREGVRAGLARVYGHGLETWFAQDPSLIGGMRIKVGDDVYDGSVKARLAALEARL
jgi:F-type H+-transporting ATPase subunit delta